MTFSLEELRRWDRQVDHGNDALIEGTIVEIERLTDRAESAEGVLRVIHAMIDMDDWSRDDVKDYLTSAMRIMNGQAESS